jgi:quercetin dioxygenase-like cupin family protein
MSLTTAAALAAIAALIAAPAALAQGQGQRGGPFYRGELPNAEGMTMSVGVIEYAPGGASQSHTHSQFVFAYVLEGAVRSQVEGEELRVYQAGEYWIENPGAHHVVSENASADEPARLLVTFIYETPPPAE